MSKDNWFMKHKVWSIIIILLIIFSIFTYFLPEDSEETVLTGNVIEENNQKASEQIQEEPENSYNQKIQSNNQQTNNYEKIQGEQNQEETKICEVGYIDEYKCDGNIIKKKWINSDCSFDWFYFKSCDYECENEKCKDKPESEGQSNYFKVTYVVDGDTIEIETGERVRLICIDTPEREEEGYIEAREYLENLILEKEIEMQKDISETDKYDRLLRYIYLSDGRFVNELIVKNGYGEVYPYSPDITLCPQIQDAENYAKSHKLGIWGKEKQEPEQEEEEEPEKEKDSEQTGNIICSCSSNIYNCDNFSTHSEAQECFNYCKNLGKGDIHKLDRDEDNSACESLP